MKRVALSLVVSRRLRRRSSRPPAPRRSSRRARSPGLTLQLNAKGEALLTYTAGGKRVHVLAWGAVNAIPTKPGHDAGRLQARLLGRLPEVLPGRTRGAGARQASTTRSRARPATSRARSIKKLRAAAARRRQLLEDRVPRRLRPVRRAEARLGGRRLQGAGRQLLGRPGVAAQASRLRPRRPTGARRRARGPPLALDGRAAGADGEHRLVVAPVEPPLRHVHLRRRRRSSGSRRPSSGQPLDSFGRNLYLDTFDSAYGTGWKRENSFLTHKGDGVFCYSVNPHPGHPAGTGTEYRATIMGPGVTPDVMWTGPAPGAVRQGDRRAAEHRDLGPARQALQAELSSRTAATGSTASRATGALGRARAVIGDGDEQRALFRRWPAGVSVVVAESGGRRAGLTVSSLVSVSLDAAARLDLARRSASLFEVLRRGGRVGGLDPRRRPGRTSRSTSRAACRRSCSGTASPCARTTRGCSTGAVGWIVARTVDERRRRRPRDLRRRGRVARAGARPGRARLRRPRGTSPL